MKIRFLTSNIIALSIVSLLADLSTEMIIPILPLFLVGTLGASYAMIGLIGGSSDSVTSLVKIFSGWYADKFGKRKPFVVLGYLPTAILKPLLSFAQTPMQVFALSVSERIGKGVRGAPRDAIIAESVDVKNLGRAFGFHRAFDTTGAVIGSFLGFIFLTTITGNTSETYREIFVISAVPAIISVVIGQVFVKEKKLHETNYKDNTRDNKKQRTGFLEGIRTFDSKLKFFLLISSVFAFANFNLAFFILRAKDMGVSDVNILLLYTLFNVLYALVSYPFGILSDKIGRDKVVMMSFAAFILTTTGFAFFATSIMNMIILFSALGIYMGIFDGSQKSYVSEISSDKYKATALGAVATLTGIITLPASLAAGIFWDKLGPAITFEFAAGIAFLALIMFAIHRSTLKRPIKY